MDYSKIDGLWVMVKKKWLLPLCINPFVGLRLASPIENLDSRGNVSPEVST